MFTTPSIRIRRKQAEEADASQSERKKQATGSVRPTWLAPLQQPEARKTQGSFGDGKAHVFGLDFATGENSRGDLFAASDAPEETDGGGEEEAELEHGQLRTLLRGDSHAVFAVSGFPEQVSEFLKAARIRAEPVSCGASAGAQFAYAASASTCLVWAYGSESYSSVYKLEMPPNSNGDKGAPVISLISDTTPGDVGVVACSSSGQLRYWDRVVFGLGGTLQYLSVDISPSLQNDACVRAVQAYTDLVIVATQRGKLFQVSLGDSTGLAVRTLSRSSGSGAGGMLERVSSFLGSSQPLGVAPSDSLVGIAAGARTEMRQSREILMLTRTRLLKWVVSRSHADRLLYSSDVSRVISHAVAQRFGEDVDATMLDVAATSSGDACILVAMQAAGTGQQARLAVAVFRSANSSTDPSIAALWPLEHTCDPHTISRSRLMLPNGGPGLFVVLPSAVTVLALPALASSSCPAFETSVSFRNSDAVVGFGAGADSSLEIVCSLSGILRMAIDGDSAQSQKPIGFGNNVLGHTEFSADAEPVDAADISDIDPAWPNPASQASRPAGGIASQTRAFIAQLEQAVFFDNPRSPLSFSIASHSSSGIDTALQAAVLQVSKSILDSSSRFIAGRLDTGAQLRERLRRAHAIIRVLSANGLVDRIDTSTRVRLSAAAEKLAAAVALWSHQNDLWARQHSSPATHLLSNAADAFLEARGLRSRDALRELLQHHTCSVGDLVVFLHGRVPALRRALDVSERGAHDSRLVEFEASRIAIVAMLAAFRYRFRHSDLYALASNCSEELWTASAEIADILSERLENIYALCRDLSSRHCAPIYERMQMAVLPGDTNHDGTDVSISDEAVCIDYSQSAPSELAAVLPADDDPYVSDMALLRDCLNIVGPLANLCFRSFVDRITFVETRSAPDAAALVRRYNTLRSRFLLGLVALGRVQMAFRLSEEYHDLTTLVVLVFAADAANAADCLRRYIDMFGSDFARALFAYYERRQAWASLLYTRDSAIDRLLKEFIDTSEHVSPHGPMAQIGWIHDIKLRDFGGAAAKLARAARDSDDTCQARTMLSLSKLSFVALEGLDSIAGGNEIKTSAYSRLEDALELCEVQDSLHRFMAELVESNQQGMQLAAKPTNKCNMEGGSSSGSDNCDAYDAAMLTTSPELRHSRPALYATYCDFLRRLLASRVASTEEMLDALTFPDNIPNTNEHFVNERYCLAVDILSRSGSNLTKHAQRAALRSIWRRVFISDDWKAIHLRLSTPNTTDIALRSELIATNLYHTLRQCLVLRELPHPECYVMPADAFVTADDLEYFADNRFCLQLKDSVEGTTIDTIIGEYKLEDKDLSLAINNGLVGYYEEMFRIVAEDAKDAHRQREGKPDCGMSDDLENKGVEDEYENDVNMDSE
ncbi:hypothetical protein H4R99_004000 [Coemansia sp. RSA 1722]|nr:hypothetical protein H4R99_004000 [Coemansia sp. RSA 1722]